ncbi:hypothetical protein [Marinobacter sp. DUT-1]|uniref:hypothetical protein n=1 Tax=Marinobacter sp. DUT-1 TaxID=3412037 RepID=UPI003D18453C
MKVKHITFHRRRAAIHEAGHAISHAAHGIRVKSVSIQQTGPHWEGWTATEWQPGITPDSLPETDLALACGHLSGHVSEQIHAAPLPPASNIEEIAHAMACQEAMAAKGQDVDLQGYAWALLEKNRAALLRLADNLMLSRKLSGSRLRFLLREVSR